MKLLKSEFSAFGLLLLEAVAVYKVLDVPRIHRHLPLLVFCPAAEAHFVGSFVPMSVCHSQFQ